MKRAIVIGVVIVGVGVVCGGGYYYVTQQIEEKFQDNINALKSTFSGVTITYENRRTNVFSREITLEKVVIQDQYKNTYTADKLKVGFEFQNAIPKISMDKLAVKTKLQNITADHLDLKDLKTNEGWVIFEDGKVKKLVFSKINFSLLDVTNISWNLGNYNNIKIAQYQLKNYGLGKKSDAFVKDFNVSTSMLDFKLSSFKLNQFNLADTNADQEKIADQYNERQDANKLTKQIIENLSHIEFDKFSFDGMQFVVKQRANFSVSHYDMQNYGKGRKINQTLNGLSWFNMNDHSYFKIEKLEDHGYDLASLWHIASKIDFIQLYRDNSYIGKVMQQVQTDYLKLNNSFTEVTKISNVSASDGQNKVAISNFTSDGKIDMKGNASAVYSLKNFVFSAPQNTTTRVGQALQEFGYDNISFSGDVTFNYQVETKDVEIALKNWAFKDMATFNASLSGKSSTDFDFFNYEDYFANPQTKLKSFKFSFQNTGIVEKIVDITSKNRHISPEEVKELYISSVQDGVDSIVSKLSRSDPQDTNDTKVATFGKEVKDAWAAFINDPQKQKLDFSMDTDEPVSFMDINDGNEKQLFDKLFDKFKVQFKAEPLK